VSSSKKYGLNAKKSIHVNITKSAHAAFRIACFQRGLSMQEVFEEFAQRVAMESNGALRILDELKIFKENKQKRGFAKADIDDIFNVLEEENPLLDD